jgi:hypothetical protein
VELVAALPGIRSYVIADLYLELDAVEVGRRVVFLDAEGRCVLVAGCRLVAWPTLSRLVRWACAPLVARARRRPAQRVLLLGPQARELLRTDPRVTTRVHDVFTPWPAPAPDVIKVANVLRRLYFDDEAIVRALHALHAGLDEGGHLLVVDNPRVPGVDLRAGLYRRSGGWFEPVATTEHPPEIADLLAVPVAARG